MKIRIYPSDYTKTLLEMTSRATDENGDGYYIIDVKDITGHKQNNIKQESLIGKSKSNKKK